MVYYGYYLSIATLPFVIIYAHAFPWQFYMIAVLQGIMISYADSKYFQAFHKFGSENVAAIFPLVDLITFFIWMIFKPEVFLLYYHTPYRFLLILISICLIVLSASKYRAHTIGKECLKFTIPLLFLSSFILISTKVIMYYADDMLFLAAIHRVFYTGLIIGTINLLMRRKDLTTKQIFDPKNLKKGLFILLVAINMIPASLSMYYATNPAYSSALMSIEVVWVMLINKVLAYFGQPIEYKTFSKKWIFVLLIASTVLSIVAN